MKTLNLLAIRIDGGTQTRKELNTQAVDEYAELMKEGHQFPLMVVFHDGSDYWLSSGFHRYFANKKNGTVSVDVDLRQGTVEDALRFSLTANKDNGMRPTHADNRYAIEIMLNHPKWSKYTNTVIAKEIGVTSMTVGRVKLAMIEAKKLKEFPTEKTYIDKNKGEVAVKTENLKRNFEKETPVYDKTEDQLKELSTTIENLDDENAKLKDIIASNRWIDATDIEIEDIQDTLKELRETIKILEMENKTLRDSRDMYQSRNAELIRQVKSLQKKK
jgi:hypothetical protein